MLVPFLFPPTIHHLHSSVNRIVFNAEYADLDQAEIFEYLKLPPPEPRPPAPMSGVAETPEHDFSEAFSSFAFHSFLMRPEVVQVLIKIQEDCNKVSGSTKFKHCGLMCCVMSVYKLRNPLSFTL